MYFISDINGGQLFSVGSYLLKNLFFGSLAMFLIRHQSPKILYVFYGDMVMTAMYKHNFLDEYIDTKVWELSFVLATIKL